MTGSALCQFLAALTLTAVATLGGAEALCAEILAGLAAPLTGQWASGGEQAQYGAELAMTELNAEGGLLGQSVALDLADDYCEAEQAVAAARKLVADKITVAIGHGCSGAAISASDVYEAARIPFLTIATNPLLTERGLRFTFRVAARDEAQATLAADYMVRQLGARRIAIVHDTRRYGKGLAELTSKRLAELGVPETLFEAVQPDQLVYAGLIEKLQGARVQALYYGGYAREAGLLRRQASEAKFFPPMVAGDGIAGEDYALIAGPAAEGTLMTADRPLETTELAEFNTKFRTAYKVQAYRRAKLTYVSAKIWAQAVAAAGTTDGATVANALRSERFNVLGVDVHFDDKGDMRGSLAEAGLWVWRDGKPVPLQLGAAPPLPN